MIRIKTLSLKSLALHIMKCPFSISFNAKINYFEVLGLTNSASEDEIKKAFLVKVK